MADSSWVYGLRHQARCLTAVAHCTEKSKFLVGTVGVKNNAVVQLVFDEDASEITSVVYPHPDEVWDLAACPVDERLFFSTHCSVGSDPTRDKKATLWRMMNDDSGHALQDQITLNGATRLQKVLWDPRKENSRVVALGASTLQLFAADNADSILSFDTQDPIQDTPTGWLQNAAWQDDTVIGTHGQNMTGWDVRSGKQTFTHTNAHKATIRAIDINPNRPYHVATGGDDAAVHIWDVRQLTEPALTVEGHTHWVWSVAFNSFHDQLLLTSGSDTLVHLHNVVSVSSASYLKNNGEQPPPAHSPSSEEPDTEDYWQNYRPSDGLIATYDQHEDSVYAVAWSPADTWTFASLSYAGRVVISQVPTGEKFKILGV